MVRVIVTLGVLQGLTIIVQVVRTKAISVVLGPAGLGIVGLIDQLIAVVTIVCALSLPTVVLRVMPRVHGEPAFGRQYASFLQAVAFASILGSIATGLVFLLQPAAFGEVLASYATEFRIALVSVPLLAVGLLLPNVLAASMRPVGAAWLSFGLVAVATVASIAGLLWGGIREIYILQAVAMAALLAAALVYFKVKLHLPFRDPSASLVREIRARPDIIPNAGAVYASLIGSAITLLVVRYVTVHSIGTEAGGLLQAILSMVLAVGAVMIAMSARYLGPLLNRPLPLPEKLAVSDQFRRRQLIILIALAVPLVLFADLALTILFSSEFTSAAAWLPAFLIWQLLAIQINVQLQLLFAFDELKVVTVMSIAGSALSALLCAVWIPMFGLSGAAAALVAGAALTMGIGAERLRRRHRYGIGRSSLLLGGYAVVVLLAAPYAMQGAAWGSVPLKILACVVLIGGLWPFLSGDEKGAIKRIGRRSADENSAR